MAARALVRDEQCPTLLRMGRPEGTSQRLNFTRKKAKNGGEDTLRAEDEGRGIDAPTTARAQCLGRTITMLMLNDDMSGLVRAILGVLGPLKATL